MIQTPGTGQAPGTEVVAQTAVAPQKRSFKKTLRMVGAGAISATLVGVFALPAYASSNTSGSIGTAEEAQVAFAQALTTSSLSDIAVPDHLPTAEEQELIVETPVIATESEAGPSYAALPAGAGASGLVAAAYAQLGVAQDCTDLVQNALAAVGLTTSRLAGGPDLGVGSFASFGAVYGYDVSALAPGDILIWPNAPHAAVYVGGGQAIHGGWGGTTQLSGLLNWGVHAEYVVRI